MITLYCDGASNEFECATCVVLKKINGRTVNSLKKLEDGTNSITAEYLALIHALELVGDSCKIYTDNKGIAGKFKGDRVPKKYFEFWKRIKELIKGKNIIVKWCPREQNLAGIFLENRLLSWKEGVTGLSKKDLVRRSKGKLPKSFYARRNKRKV